MEKVQFSNCVTGETEMHYLEFQNAILQVSCNHHLVFRASVEQKAIGCRSPKGQHDIDSRSVIGNGMNEQGMKEEGINGLH